MRYLLIILFALLQVVGFSQTPVLDIDFRDGSYIEKYSGLAGVNVGNSITRQEKGLAYAARQANSGQITFPNLTALNFGTSAFSIVCAFRMGEFINVGSSSNVIFSNTSLNFYYGSSQILSMWVFNGADVTIINGFDWGALNDGQYHLVVFTFDETTYKAYLDGVKESGESTTIRSISTAGSYYVGRDANTSRRSNSDILYIKAYDYALSATERSKLQSEFENSYPLAIEKHPRYNPHSKPTSLNEYGLVAAYNFIAN